MHKPIDQQLKELAEKLPKTYTIADSFKLRELENRQLAQFRAKHVDVNESQGPAILTDQRNVVKVQDIRLHPVNHLRRLRNAYKSGKVPAVHKYILWVGKNNEMLNNLYDQKMVIDVATEISMIL